MFTANRLTGKMSVNRFAINRSETDKMAANWHTSNPPHIGAKRQIPVHHSVIVNLPLDVGNLSSMD